MILPSLSIVPYAHNRAGNMFTQFPLDGGFTVSSSDQGTIVNSDGLIERSPKNLCINTQNFTAGSWAQTNSPTVVNNAELAPDGTMTAALMTDGQIQYAPSIGVVGKEYTCSLYIRRISGTGDVRFRAIENFNTPVSVTSEWQRFSLTVAATSPTLRIGINLESGTSTVAIWGAQIEESLTPTAYQRVDASRLNFPRIDWLGQSCPGLLVEPSATNSIRNNSMVGAVAGSPGTLPTNWAESLNGLVRQSVALGTENGVSYIDIRYSGTASGSSAAVLFETATQIVASTGQTWSNSVYLKIIAQPTPPVAYRLSMWEYNTSGTVFGGSFATAVVPTTTSLQRFTQTRALTGATTDRIRPLFDVSMTSGQSYDFTIRIGYPQMELGSVATSVIPTTSGTGSRAADVISASGALVSGLIGQTEGTIYVEFEHTSNTAERRVIALSDGTATNRIFIWAINNILYAQIQGNSMTIVNPIPSGYNKVAFAYQQNGVSGNLFASINGGAVVSGTSTTYPSTLSRVAIGSSENAAAGVFQWNNRIRAAALYTTRLDNYELMAMTSLDTSYEQLAARLSYAT